MMKIEHVVIYIKDVGAVKSFFEKNPFIEYRAGFTHLAFSVGSKENVDVLTQRLSNDGYIVMSGPRTTGEGYYESCVRCMGNLILEITV